MRNRRRKNRQRRQRRRSRKPQFYRRSSLILLLSFIYVMLYVLPVFLKQYQGAEVGPHELVSQGMFDLFTTYIQIVCLFFALTVSRLLWLLLWPVIGLLTAINDYGFSVFHEQISKYAVAEFMDGKLKETESLFSLSLILAFAGAFCFVLLGFYMLSREKKDLRNRKTALLALMFAAGIIAINQGGMSNPYPPYNILTAAYQYVYERFLMHPSERKDIAQYPAEYAASGKDPLVVVVVIGESARGDHFHIDGYERETTPLLEKREHLVNFKDTLSCGVWTRTAVPCLMTRATIADPSAMYAETSFISVFKKLGFYTAWLSTQGKVSVTYPVTSIAYEAEDHIMLEEQQALDNTIKDEQLLPLLDERLEKHAAQPMLIVLHTYGSHWQYSARYTREFEKFTPTCATTLSRKYDEQQQLNEIKDCYANREALVNSYDNSILYTDYILDEVIKRLENKNALFVYTSDHGESLGERGRFLHGHADRAENHLVPMFWWASDEYAASHPDRWNALVRSAATPTTHDVIFHSVLDCAGVASPLIDPGLSLCHVDGQPVESPKPLEAIPPGAESLPESLPESVAESVAEPAAKQTPAPPPDEEETDDEEQDHANE